MGKSRNGCNKERRARRKAKRFMEQEAPTMFDRLGKHMFIRTLVKLGVGEKKYMNEEVVRKFEAAMGWRDPRTLF